MPRRVVAQEDAALEQDRDADRPRPGKRLAELPKNAPSACTVMGDVDETYRVLPDDVKAVLARRDAGRSGSQWFEHESETVPLDSRLRRGHNHPDPEIKIHHPEADAFEQPTDAQRQLLLRLKRLQTEFQQCDEETDRIRRELAMAKQQKRRHQAIKLMSKPPCERTPKQQRFVATIVQNTAAADANPLLRGSNFATGLRCLPKMRGDESTVYASGATERHRAGKAQVKPPVVARDPPILTNTVEALPRRSVEQFDPVDPTIPLEAFVTRTIRDLTVARDSRKSASSKYLVRDEAAIQEMNALVERSRTRLSAKGWSV